jgi:hypothetical protein
MMMMMMILPGDNDNHDNDDGNSGDAYKKNITIMITIIASVMRDGDTGAAIETIFHPRCLTYPALLIVLILIPRRRRRADRKLTISRSIGIEIATPLGGPAWHFHLILKYFESPNNLFSGRDNVTRCLKTLKF